MSQKLAFMSGPRRKKTAPRSSSKVFATFDEGARALLRYRRKKREGVELVTVVSAIVDVPVDDARAPVRVLGYRVRSDRGGELVVSPTELRPGSVLDQIDVAIDRACSEVRGSAQTSEAEGRTSRSDAGGSGSRAASQT